MQTLVRNFARFTAFVSAVFFPIAIMLEVVYALLIKYFPELQTEGATTVFEVAPAVTAGMACVSCLVMHIYLCKSKETPWNDAALKGVSRGCVWLLVSTALCLIPSVAFVSFYWNDFQWGLKTYKAIYLANDKKYDQAHTVLSEARKISSGNAMAAIDLLEARFLSEESKTKEAIVVLENTLKQLKETSSNDLVMIAITDGTLTSYYEDDEQLEKAEKSQLECIDYIQKSRQSGKFQTFFNGLGKLFNQVPLPALSQQKLRLMGIYMDEGKFELADKIASDMLSASEQNDFDKDSLSAFEQKRGEIKENLNQKKESSDEQNSKTKQQSKEQSKAESKG